MAIKKVAEFAYFVVDSSAYFTHIVRYDPLIANQTLTSPAMAEEEIEEEVSFEAVVDLERLRAAMPTHQSLIEQLTPSNRDLLELAKRLPAPPAWLEGDEQCPF